MRLIRATNAAAVFLLLGTIVPMYAQHDRHDEEQGRGRGQHPHGQPPERRGHEQQRAEQPRQQPPERQRGPENREPRPAEGFQHARQEQMHRAEQEAVRWQQQRGWLHQGGWQGRGTWQQNRAHRWANDHRTWAQRGGYGGYFIPQDRFVLYFGSRHGFRIRTRPTIYMGYPRFSYGGFSFLLVDPWPEYWPENWYDSDDLYIDYNDGYYLYDRRHPGVGLAISVVM